MNTVIILKVFIVIAGAVAVVIAGTGIINALYCLLPSFRRWCDDERSKCPAFRDDQEDENEW